MRFLPALIVVAIAAFALSMEAGATTISINDGGVHDGAEVGFVDTLLATHTKPNGPDPYSGSPEAEELWVNSILNPSDTATYTVKFDSVTHYSTDATDTYAVSFLDTDPRPDYFLVKNSTSQALYDNQAYVGWGVFDVSLLNDSFQLGGESFTVSHVTLFEGDGRGLCNPDLDPTCLPSVPVPPAVWLFGSGLLGLVGVARRKDA